LPKPENLVSLWALCALRYSMYCLYATDISFMEVCMCHVGLEKADLVGLFQREFF
jgi:hypothetical protein